MPTKEAVTGLYETSTKGASLAYSKRLIISYYEVSNSLTKRNVIARSSKQHSEEIAKAWTRNGRVRLAFCSLRFAPACRDEKRRMLMVNAKSTKNDILKLIYNEVRQLSNLCVFIRFHKYFLYKILLFMFIYANEGY